ncbi:septal ring lytic transglycosylase RlpA family protein [Camelimonas abortus]|uniref:Endolytic peptidoglycan transglycosylase RlpA n=2 Tax=Camelimonas abortus TaxID=1017184 RepID=A0ABV7LHS3_9HYPH
MAGVIGLALLAANCAGMGAREGAKQDRYNRKLGVSSSPRVVKDGQPVPKGGGRAMIGKPYTVAGRRYVPFHDPHYTATGVASWYGTNFHGRLTANGEVFDKYSIAAAHPTLPLPSYARVTNLDNGLSLIVRVNDRGPYHGKRIIDVSKRAAELLQFRHMGTARVKVDYVRPASVHGSDDEILAGTLTAGAPAQLDGGPAPVMVAKAQERDAGATRARSDDAPGAGVPQPQEARAQLAELSGAAGSREQEEPSRPHLHLALNAGAQADDAADEVALAGLPKVAPLPPVRPVMLAAGH